MKEKEYCAVASLVGSAWLGVAPYSSVSVVSTPSMLHVIVYWIGSYFAVTKKSWVTADEKS